jgi:hypothetical protein
MILDQFPHFQRRGPQKSQQFGERGDDNSQKHQIIPHQGKGSNALTNPSVHIQIMFISRYPKSILFINSKP